MLHYNILDPERKEILPKLDPGLILKSLVYFEDIEEEPINFK